MSTYTAPTPETLRDLPLPTQAPALKTFTDATTSPATLSHLALHARIAHYTAILGALALPPQSKIALILLNSPHFIISFLAITHSNHVAAPLNPAYTDDEFRFYLSDAAIDTILIASHTAPDAPIHHAAAALNIPIHVVPDNLVDPDAPIPPATIPADPDHVPIPSSTALFLHTSGTTSRPKGVPLTHKNLATSITNIAQTYQLSPTDSTLLVMPLFHVHGLMAATLATLYTGGCVVLLPGGKFSASKFWPVASVANISWYTAVPTIHQILLARADDDYPGIGAPKLRFIRSCSASLAPVVLQRLEDRFSAPVLEAYAMTEAAHQMTSNPLPTFGVHKPGSVGVAQGGVSVAVLDGENSVVKPGVVGEVCIRGDNVTSGYVNNAEANEAAFAGGWFHTGDQGILDQEGYLSLTGRIKELVNRGGEKISPLEVDAVLLAFSKVQEAVSFAVADEKYGEEVNAAIVWKAGVEGSVDELETFAKERLAAFKMPKRFFVTQELPRTATGKIQRRIVSKHFLDKINA